MACDSASSAETSFYDCKQAALKFKYGYDIFSCKVSILWCKAD